MSIVANNLPSMAQPAGVSLPPVLGATSPTQMGVAGILPQFNAPTNTNLTGLLPATGLQTGNTGTGRQPDLMQVLQTIVRVMLPMISGMSGPQPALGQPGAPALTATGRIVKNGLAGQGANVTNQFGFLPDNNNLTGLTTGQRVQQSDLSPEEIGSLHYFGRGVATAGRKGGYAAVWQARDEAAQGIDLIQKYGERDGAFLNSVIRQGQLTGQDPAALAEQLFLRTTDKIGESTRGTFSNMIANQPPMVDDGTRVNIKSIDNNLTTSKSFFSQWYHDRLDNKRVDGSIWFTELASGNALMKDGVSMQMAQAMARLEAADGDIANNSGNKLITAGKTEGLFTDTFRQMYFSANGESDLTVDKINALADAEAAKNGFTVAQVNQMVSTTVDNFKKAGTSLFGGIGQGVGQGVGAAADLMGSTTGMLTGAAGTALSTMCPFFSGGMATAQASLVGGKAPPANHQAL